MKRLFVVFGVFVIPALSWGFGNYVDDAVYTSSFTLSNETVSVTTKPGSSFYGVCVGSPTVNGVITIFDGWGNPYVSTITILSMVTQGCQPYNVSVSSGVSYRTAGNANGVTILYRNRQVQ
jgi:hypothetical protein